LSKHIRKTANYFKPLPQADPLTSKPVEDKEAQLSENAIKSLLPEWANRPVDTSDDGSPNYPKLPDDHNWEHLLDSNETEEADSAKDSSRKEKAKGWVATLVSQQEAGKATSPQSVVSQDAVRMKRIETRTLSGEWGDPMKRLRKVGLELAKNHKHVSSPVFQRTKTEGLATNDYPLPGTSFALMGIRGSFGRQQVASSEIESDRIFYDKADMRHSGLPDLASAPLTAYRARSMKAGERFRIRSERSILAESGIKYTPIAIPGVTSSMVHDLGPSGQVEFTVAVESETSLEVVRGFGSKVAVCIAAQEDHSEPGDDHKIQTSVGAFIDGSLGEYISKAFGKMASSNVDEELKTLQERKQNMDSRILPHTEKFNKTASISANQHKKNTSGALTLYEVVFDLSKPKARKIYDQLVGGANGQQIDFTALAQLPDDCGVELVSNHVQTASRKGLERTFAAFGYEWWHKGKIAEKKETKYGDLETGTKVLEENHGLVRRSSIPGRSIESTTVARVKTVNKSDEDKPTTGVGFGWRYKIDRKHASVSDLAQMLAFASVAGVDPQAKAQLQQLYEFEGEIPRKKLLGMAIGKRTVGETSAEFSLELNVDAVTTLLAHFDSAESEKELWVNLAKAYATNQNLDEAPAWPLEHLVGDGLRKTLSRNVLPHSTEENAFLTAQTAVEILRQAKEATDPIECAKKLGQTFDMLRNDLALASGLIEASRPEGGTGVELTFELKGAENAKAAAARKAPPVPNTAPQES
jgi:hypothetical protein